MLKIFIQGVSGDTPLAAECFTFPAGEAHVRAPVLDAPPVGAQNILIRALLKNSHDVMFLLMATDALRRAYPFLPIDLDMPYVPYARQDRVANPGEALGVKVFAELINAQNYRSVRIEDPHSDVAPALLNRVTVVDASAYVAKVLKQPEFAAGVTLIAPDAGARKRVLSIAQKLGIEDVGFADKKRNTVSGKLDGFKFPVDIPRNQPALVVDDICDGGGTFVGLASAAQETVLGGMDLYLYVTHGIFSKGLEPIAEAYERVYTAHNWTSWSHHKVIQINA